MIKKIIVILCLSLCGCATNYKTEVGNPAINQENIAKIVRGKTTQQDILNVFGSPVSKSQMGVLGTMWTYSRSVSTLKDHGFLKGMSQDVQALGVSIMFDENGIVKDFSYSEVNPVQDVKATVF